MVLEHINQGEQGTILHLASPKTDAVLYLSEVRKEFTAGRYRLVPDQLVKFYYIYVLHNPLKNFIYIGYSEDLKSRVISHNKGENKSTKAYLPLELIHYEAYKNMKDAKRRELYLKSNKGRTTLITMLKEYFEKPITE